MVVLQKNTVGAQIGMLYNIMKNKSLTDLYKFTKNNDGSYTIAQEEFERFAENFEDYLQIRYALKTNDYVNDAYTKLYTYSKWFNEV